MAIYSDINQRSPNLKPRLYDEVDVMQSIENILSTKGDRIFRPEIDCDLEKLLFDPLDDATALAIYKHSIDMISRFEPRARLVPGASDVVPDYEKNAYSVIMVYEIIGVPDKSFTFEGIIVRPAKA